MNDGARVYVQYGCGACAPAEWLNFDASPRLRLERLPVVGWIIQQSLGAQFQSNVRPGDIICGLPVPDGSAVAAYCSHVLEHLARGDLSIALRNTHRILAPGGRFRLVVPDLFWRARNYVQIASQGDPQAADRFMETSFLGKRKRTRGLLSALRSGYGNSDHQWMYDYAGMKRELERNGFENVRRCELGDSGDPMFQLVEDRGRFFEGDQRELAIEAIKPA